jgi:hypothetical protein
MKIVGETVLASLPKIAAKVTHEESRKSKPQKGTNPTKEKE